MAEEKSIIDQGVENDSYDDGENLALLSYLPREKNLMVKNSFLYYYEGFWYSDLLTGCLASQKSFTALDDDIILTSCPRSGTIWLKSLVYSIVNRSRFSPKDSPLCNTNPHDLVLTLEVLFKQSRFPNFEAFCPPRMFTTHSSYGLLPISIKSSKCKIVYVSRNPMDQFVSYWHFGCKIKDDKGELRDLEECFDSFCRGIHGCGPFWDHVLGFWKASLKRPDKILFLKYEDLTIETTSNVKKLARFLGFPFSKEEENRGVVEEIVTFCSLANMKSLDSTKIGRRPYGILHSALYRKGEVGDYKNFLTKSMIWRMKNLMQEKYSEYGLTYDIPM